MSESTGISFCVICAICAVVATMLIISQCSRANTIAEYEAKAKERQQMIDAGYEQRQVPNSYTQAWVKKEESE